MLSVRSPRAPARCSARGARCCTFLRLPLRHPSLSLSASARRSQRIDRLRTRHRSARRGFPGGSAGTDLPRRLCDVGGYPQYPFSQPGGDSNGAVRATRAHGGCTGARRARWPHLDHGRAGRFTLVDRRLPALRWGRRAYRRHLASNPHGQRRIGSRPRSHLPRTDTRHPPGPAMSTQIAPRPRASEAPRRRTSTRPTPTRPIQPAPFRWSQDPELAYRAAPSPTPTHYVTLPKESLPDPGPWAANLARAIVEVVTGVRQAPQLRRWMLPDLYGALVCVHMSPCARGTRPVHVRTCPVDERTTEAAVIVSTVSRTFALALRLEEYHGRWITTALELA